MTLEAKLTSIKDTLQGNYVKPEQSTVDRYIADLSSCSSALDYLHITRGLNPETLENFKIGYCKEKNAISIPVYKRGELINIRYRHLDENARAKYTQERGCEVWLYNEEGIAKGQSKGGVLIVEGEFDCMSCWQAGFKNVISPASGKDSYGVWIELLDTIPKCFIAYDNDKPGKAAALNLAGRIGTEKSFEVQYPEGIKDANDYFKVYSADDYKTLIRKAQPFYKYTYQGLDSVIESIKVKGEKRLQLPSLPFVKIDDDWMIMVSGVSGVGKTSYVMNLAHELMEKDIPTLVLPFERGMRTVGGRYLQVKLNKTEDELIAMDDSEWDKILPDVVNLPLYFSLPTTQEVKPIVERAKRLFGVKVVIVDHLDYSIIPSNGTNEVAEMKKVLQEWKTICLENNVIFIVVHHIRKQDVSGVKPKKPKMEDLKGGSASYQVPEAVVLLSIPEKGEIEVDVVKNKGPEGSATFEFNGATGKISKDITLAKTEESSDTEPTKPKQQSWDDFSSNF
jgi:thymidylate kinase